MPAITPSWSRTMSALGWAKIVRIAAATISALPFGNWARTLCRKCTRHRCHAAPMSTAAMACFNPMWASAMTSCTPTESAGLHAAQECGPERAVLAVPDREPEDFAPTVGADP
jgi:hypothetical protein